MQPRMSKGPAEVLRALAFGTGEDVREALAFQRESFRAAFGCYPEELAQYETDQGGSDEHSPRA